MGDWKKYDAILAAGEDSKASAENRLVISTSRPGIVWFSMASLFPPTFDNRPNGNRRDIMQLLGDMHPAFLRLPGGNYLEGNRIATRFEWKKTIGDISQRPGRMDDAWHYWSADGMELLEFLEWCEDLHLEPLLAVYAGYSLDGERVPVGDALAPYVSDALDEIEYVTGDSKTTWGTRRAKDGHPKPFPLNYVEVGNEDNFDRRDGGTYDSRFTQFFDAIKDRHHGGAHPHTRPDRRALLPQLRGRHGVACPRLRLPLSRQRPESDGGRNGRRASAVPLPTGAAPSAMPRG
jgi:alpha-L-arabinofuranosidase